MSGQTCTESLAQEFKPESLGVEHENPSDFVRSQWPVSQKVYVGYRIVVALGLLAWIVADILYESNAFYKDRIWVYLIYATNWSFILLVFTSIFQAVCVIYYSVRHSCLLDRQSFERMPPSLKLQWCLQNLAYNTAIVVSISYWSFIAFLDNSEILSTNMSRLKHTLNTVYIIVDIFISAAPMRILHMLFAVMLGSIYSLFNAIYFLNDGTILEGRHYAYNVLNWENPSEAVITCILCVVQAVISQFILYEIYKIRSWIFRRIYFDSDVSTLPSSTSELQSIMTESPKYMTLDDKRGGIDDIPQ